MKKRKKIIIPVIILLIILGLTISYQLSIRIASNPPSATGNTAGNLNSKGLFCEYNGIIYFSNPYDSGKLYSMKSDCSSIKYLSDNRVSYINAYGEYLYYVKNNSSSNNASVIFRTEMYGLVRSKLNGTHVETIVTGYCNDLSLTGNSLLYNATNNSSSVTYAVSIKGDDNKLICTDDYSNACAKDGQLYYSNTGNNHSIYSMDISNGSTSLFCNGNTYMANVVDNYLYYIDLDNNYSLVRINLSNYDKQVITNDHCVLYNVYNNVIYYQKEGNNFSGDTTHALMMSNLDGSNPIKVITGDVTSISCTSIYTFFQLYGSDNLYRAETNTGNNVQTFFIQQAR